MNSTLNPRKAALYVLTQKKAYQRFLQNYQIRNKRPLHRLSTTQLQAKLRSWDRQLTGLMVRAGAY